VDIDSIAAVMYMHDDDSWGRDIQVICDALLAGVKSRGIQTPMYFSNPDFIYAANHPMPRLAQGAFKEALRTVYERLSGLSMSYTSFGKPNVPTYDNTSIIKIMQKLFSFPLSLMSYLQIYLRTRGN